jgi:hypothetical protein
VLACRGGDHESLDSFFVLDSFVERLVDPVGAGDALLAYSTLAMLATRDPSVATILGTFAAAVECEVDGNLPVGVKDVYKKLDPSSGRCRSRLRCTDAGDRCRARGTGSEAAAALRAPTT